MNQAEKDQLVSMFNNHLNEILRLHPSNIQGAEALYHRTKMFAEKYFPTRGYGVDLIGIKFRSNPIFENAMNVWNIAISKLSGIARAMHDDILLTPAITAKELPAPNVKLVEDTTKIKAFETEIGQLKQALEVCKADLLHYQTELLDRKRRWALLKRYSKYILAFLLFSITLWTFNSWLKWSWLNTHPKRLGLYLSLQVLLLLAFSLPILKGDKTLKFTVIGGMGVTVIVGFLQLL